MATADIVAALRRMNLVAEAEQPQIVSLTGGVSSQILLVRTATRSFCVKRALAKLNVAAEWRAPIERNHTEIQWLRLAAAIVPGCVPAILAADGEQHLFAMEYFDANEFTVWKALLLAGQTDALIAGRVASTLARLHAATAANQSMAREFANAVAFETLRIEPYFGEVARLHTDLALPLARLAQRTRQTSLALIHGDVSPKNILVNAQRVVFLDAECATYGDPAFDLAFCLTHLLLKATHRSERAHDYAVCFRRLATDYLSEVTWESPMDLEVRAATLLPAIALGRVDGKSPAEYLVSDKVRQRVRVLSRRFICDQPESLGQLLDSWLQELR